MKTAALILAIAATIVGEWTLRKRRPERFFFVVAFLSSELSFRVQGYKEVSRDNTVERSKHELDSCVVHHRPNGDCISDDHEYRVHVYGEENIHRLYEDTLEIFLKVVQDNPKAVILLPTGSTPKPFYKKLIAHFEADATLNLSGITFFNLDEYVGLPADHPLSYHYFMEKNLYSPLRSIDSNRAPKRTHTHIPTSGDTLREAEASVRTYEELLRETIASRGGLHLAILGVGGAYPVQNKDGTVGVKGGHIAFNEPGSGVSQTAHLVQLTEKTRKDTLHRFQSLANLVRSGILNASFSADVPTHALTLGLGNILEAQKILLLAVGEEKSPALQKAFLSPKNPDIPVSFLVGNPRVLWLLDECAAVSLPDFVQTQDYYNSVPEVLSEIVNEAVERTDMIFPTGENVLVLSPHPDDDVISMGAAIESLNQRDCTVHIAYAVTGSNAVRPEFKTYKQGKKQIAEALGTRCAPEEELYPTIEMRAKAWVRHEEALDAAALLHVPSEHLHFLECEFYDRRGVEGVEALTESDLRKMKDVIVSSSAKHIFFAAENDPHGAHGLSAKLLAKVLETMSDLNVTLWGYRGAYSEWNLRESKHLSIIPFDQSLMDLKVLAIKAHASQLKPLYPSFDSREFYERATDRNRSFAQKVSKVLGHTLLTMDDGDPRPATYAEAFRRYSKEEFIQRYIG